MTASAYDGSSTKIGDTKRGGGQAHPNSPLAGIPLSTKLVASMLILLIVGTVGISVAICQMADDYLMKKTDTQLIRQAKLGIRNATLLKQEDLSKSGLGPTDYFLQIRDDQLRIISDDLNPMQFNGAISRPKLPDDGTMGSIPLGQPTTVPAYVRVDGKSSPDRDSLKRARASWRVVAMQWSLHSDIDDSDISGVLYIGLSMSDQDEAVHALTTFCLVISVIVVLLGGVISALLIQSTLVPLKRIEKTAAMVAAGNLHQRIPSFPENTEVGSLAASLNVMLARIEQSFDEQKQTTEKMKRFVSDASHELRTPLAAIHGYAELYRMQRAYPGALERADESIKHIEDSSSRMADLVSDLLSLARLDEGRGINTTLLVDVTGLVRDSMDDLHALDPERRVTCGSIMVGTEVSADSSQPLQDTQGKAAGRGHAWSRPVNHVGSVTVLSLQEGPLPAIEIQGDPNRLRQVVTNIVGNIHRYTPADSPVQVSMGLLHAVITPEAMTRLGSDQKAMSHFLDAVQVAQNSHLGTPYLVLRFVDHGPGVPKEARARLFERFYTADPSRAREKGGTGLGLAIVQSIVKAHHGMICAEETPGGGLTFTMAIPQGQVRVGRQTTESPGKTLVGQEHSAPNGSAHPTQMRPFRPEAATRPESPAQSESPARSESSAQSESQVRSGVPARDDTPLT